MKSIWRVAAPLTMAVFLSACPIGGGEGKEEAAPPPLPAVAAGETDRCYGREDLAQVASLARSELERDVLVLVDQTTQLPPDVRKSVLDQVKALAGDGVRLSVGTFSSYTESAHPEIVYESVLEPDFPRAKRDDAPMRGLRQLEGCLKERREAETARLVQSLEGAVDTNRADVQRSDVLANVKSFGARLADSPAEDRLLVLVSDLLENSSALSFYGNGALRKLEPEAELAKAERSGLVSDLEGVRVFVIGAGLPPPGAKSSRSLEEIGSLETFWKAYFEQSGAETVAIGKPRLLSPIR